MRKERIIFQTKEQHITSQEELNEEEISNTFDRVQDNDHKDAQITRIRINEHIFA